MPSFSPPLDHRKAILSLAQFDGATYEAIRRAVADSAGTKPSEVAAAVGSEADAKTIRGLMEVVATMQSIRSHYGMSVEEFVATTMDSTLSRDEPTFSDAEVTDAKKRLKELLAIDSAMSRSAKVSEVVHDHDKLLSACRVLTDVRPVFSENPEANPLEMAILHTVKLVYHEAGCHKEIYLAADASDLKNLREAVERAEKKELTLSALLREKGVEVTEIVS